STVNSARSPGFTSATSISLKLAVTQMSSSGTTLISGWPGCTSWPSSTVFLLTTPFDGVTMRVQVRVGLLQPRPVNAIIEHGERVARFHRLILTDEHGRHEAADLGQDRDDMAVHLRVVSRDVGATPDPFPDAFTEQRQQRDTQQD